VQFPFLFLPTTAADTRNHQQTKKKGSEAKQSERGVGEGERG